MASQPPALGNRLRYALPLCLGLLAGASSADIYKCRLADGTTEISNKPCPSGSGTLLARPDEGVSETRRREAEREAERLRQRAEQRDAERRASLAEKRAQQPTATDETTPPAPPSRRTVEECLRELDQRGLDPVSRSPLETACHNNPDSYPLLIAPPTPIIVPPPANASHSLSLCIQNVQKLNVAPAEKTRRLRECEQHYAPVAPAPPAMPPAHDENRPSPQGE